MSAPDPDMARALAELALTNNGLWRGSTSALAAAVKRRLPPTHEALTDLELWHTAQRCRKARHILVEHYGVMLVRTTHSNGDRFALRLADSEPTPGEAQR